MVRALGVSLLLLAVTVTASAQQRARVDPGAREVLDYRLSPEALRRVESVMRAMDGVPSRGPEAPRADVAMITVLQSSLAYGQVWRDATVDETVRTTERGHHELAGAVRAAGLSQREYVLAVMNLLLAYPVAAQRRQGRAVAVSDVAAENVAWVDANFADVERFMRELGQRIAAARGGR